MSKRVLITLNLDYDECVAIKGALTMVHFLRTDEINHDLRQGHTPSMEIIENAGGTLRQHESLTNQLFDAFKLEPK
jgi:hypothetical protein